MRRLYIRTLRQAYVLGILDLSFGEDDVPDALIDELMAKRARAA